MGWWDDPFGDLYGENEDREPTAADQLHELYGQSHNTGSSFGSLFGRSIISDYAYDGDTNLVLPIKARKNTAKPKDEPLDRVEAYAKQTLDEREARDRYMKEREARILEQEMGETLADIRGLPVYTK